MPETQKEVVPAEVRLSVNGQLKKLSEELGLRDKFETQRRNIGKAYSVANEIREASKDGISSLKSGDLENVEGCFRDMENRWLDLVKMDLPEDIAWRHKSEAGQEMVEFYFVKLLYPVLLGHQSMEDVRLPSHQDLMVTPQTWLAGIGDTVGELGKLTDDLLLKRVMTKEERMRLRERFISIGEELFDFMERLETVYEMVINNSRRKGYGNTFRGLLGRMRGSIKRQQDALIEAYDREIK